MELRGLRIELNHISRGSAMASQAFQMHCLSSSLYHNSHPFPRHRAFTQSWAVWKNSYRITLNKVFLRKQVKRTLVVRASTPEAEINTNTDIVKNEEGEARALEFLEKVREAEKQKLEELNEMERKANIQLEREYIMASSWSKQILKLQGKLKGTACDPETSHDIPFSKFWELLEKKQVQYIEYANLGNHVAVVLPYYKEDKAMAGHAEELLKDSERKIVFRRHVVKQMPVDCWNDIWKELHEQLINVEFVNANPLLPQLLPPIETSVVWAMRLVLVFVLYLMFDAPLEKIYQKKLPKRPVLRKPSLTDSNLGQLGFLGKSRARFISAEEKTGVTFDDFAGNEYVKRELQDIVKLLKQSDEFEGADVYCPKGLLLYGPPGTGKTLLARAIAGEAGVPFFSVSGSEFVEMFSGVAAARVKDLFARARQFSPSIIFIDEIDAIGAKRGGPDIGGGGVEREQGLIQILTELDGFQTSPERVLLVGATNRMDLLDPALMRKGRVDKIISVGLPTEEGRLAILKVHSKNKAFTSEEEKEQLLKEVAERAYGASGAELQNILNEAAILCTRKDKDYIGREELMEAIDRQEGKFVTGQEDYTKIPPEVKTRLAYREAAVSILECYYPNPHHPFVKTDVRTADSIPNMEYKEPRNRVFARKSDYVNSIVRVCARRIIEEEIFGVDHLSWKSGVALSLAGAYAENLILQTGFTALGKIYYKTTKDVVVHLIPKVQALRDEYVRYAVEKCSSILKEHRPALERIVDILLEKDEILADEIWDIFKKSPRIPQPPVKPLDEYGALVYVGRWGIYGISLPGRVTFSAGNVGYATYGAPTPQAPIIRSDVWKIFEEMGEKSFDESTGQGAAPDVVLSEHFV